MTTAVGLLRELASTLKTAHGEPNDISIESKDEIIRKLQRDFEGSTRAETLEGLCDILQSGEDDAKHSLTAPGQS